MAHTKVTKNGTQNTGTANTFSYSGSFNVFKASEVEVELDNVALTFTTSTINESASPREYTVDFTNKEVHIGGANLTSSNSVVIQPVTDMGAPTPRATYAPGASVTSEDLNNNQLQLMRKAMEYDEQKLSSRGGTMTGNLHLAKDIDISFEGDTDNNFETTLTVADPTADRTITFPDVTGNVVTTGDTGTVATGMIADSSITSAKIVDGTISTADIADGNITTAKLAAGGVTTAKIANDAITLQKMANDSVGTGELIDDAVTTAKIINDAVTTAKIADANVTNAKLATDSVTLAKMADNSVGTGELIADAVTTVKIIDDAVTTAKIADSNVTEAKLASNAVTTAKIANRTITAEKIAGNSITTSELGDGCVEANELANNAVATAKILDDAVTDAKLADNVSNDTLRAVSANHIKTNAVTTEKIAGTAVTDVKLASNSVTESKITDANVTEAKLASNSVTISKIGCEQTTISDSDSHIPTSGAVVDYVAAQIAPIGGLEVIATEVVFPNSQPSSGVVISISDAQGVVVNGSGTSTTGRTVGGSTVTINNFPSSLNNETLAAGVGLMVSSTGSSQTYNYHKLLAAETDVKQLSDDINDFNARYRVFAGEPSSNNDEGDLVYDTNANKMKVYDTSTSAWKEVTSTGDFKYLFLCPAGGSGAPTINGSVATYDLREGSNSGSAASVTSAAQLIVSVNGVVQKANTGTSAPAEGFALVDSNTIIFGSNLQTGDSVFIVQIGSAVTVPVPGDGTVSAAKIASGAVETAKIADNAVTGDKIADNLDLPDNNKIRFGGGNDLQIYHNGTDSHLDNTTGELALRGATIRLRGNPQNNETLAVFEENGAAKLYYDNTKRIETTSAGIDVTGDIDATDHVKINTDSKRFMAGASNDVRMYHDGSHSYFDSVTGHIYVYNHASAKAIIFGTEGNNRWQMYSSGHFVPDADSTYDIGTNGVRVRNGYFDTLYGDGSNLTGVSSVGGATGVSFNDGVFAKFGTDNDMLLYHNGNDGQLANSTGNLILANSTDGEIFIDPKNNERGIVVKPDAEVELYYNNTVQFETRDGGATTPGWFASGINAQLNGAKGTFANDGTHLSCRSFATGGYDSIIFRSANTTVGKVFFNSGGTQYHTSSDYRRKENIVDLTGAIDRVKTLQPKRFNFKTETDVTRDGFLAHEVTAVPEAIQGTKDQVATEKDVEDGKAEAVGDPIYQTIDQSALVPLLSAALKEAIAKIEVLETKVAALEAA